MSPGTNETTCPVLSTAPLGMTPQVLSNKDTAPGNLIASSSLCSYGSTKPAQELCCAGAERMWTEAPFTSPHHKGRKAWADKQQQISKAPDLLATEITHAISTHCSPPQQAEGFQPQIPVSHSSQPHPGLPYISQPQMKVREGPKLCTLALQKYSPSFCYLALLLKGWRRDRKGVGKAI